MSQVQVTILCWEQYMNKTEAWLKEIDCEGSLEAVSGDASFRKYYRLKSVMHSGIVMDSSLDKESLIPFIDINHRLFEAGVRVPKINAYNKQEGFLFMEDLGNTHLYEKANSKEFEYFYEKAIDALLKMQNTKTEGLPSYGEDFLRFEMDLMPEWYLKKHIGITLDEKQKETLTQVFEIILEEVMAQPQGLFVHRDYHSRNIMIDSCEDEIVVIDYQDARVGTVTYDLVSLVRDVYVEFNPEWVEKTALSFRDKKGLDVADETFMRWFDFMGLQRHLKILGVFSRLALRDGKKEYLNDIPLTLKYVLNVGSKYPELKGLLALLTLL